VGNACPAMNDFSMFVDMCSSSLPERLTNAAGVCLSPAQGHNSPSAATGTTGSPNPRAEALVGGENPNTFDSIPLSMSEGPVHDAPVHALSPVTATPFRHARFS